MNVKAICLWLLWSLPAWSQGFAGLGTDVTGFDVPERGVALEFPGDHLAHPKYRIEWWYLTANLTGDDGRPYGVQWTLFRSALTPDSAGGWSSPQLWMGHAGVTTQNRHFATERLARGGIGQAGVTGPPFHAFIDEWSMLAQDESLDQLSLRAGASDFSYDLDLTAQGPLVTHGDAGFSVKSPQGQASYYYSQPFYEVTGILSLPTGEVSVQGQGWLDREWSSQPLSQDQTGWDWFSLSFDDGNKLMAFRLRGSQDFTSGTWIAPDGTASPLQPGAIRPTALKTAQVNGRDIPVRWRLELPSRDVDVEIEAVNSNAWMDTTIPYWEGPVRVKGSHQGLGYLEMTGYD